MIDHDIVKAILDVCEVSYMEWPDNFGRPSFLVAADYQIAYDAEGKPSLPFWVIQFHANGKIFSVSTNGR